MTYAPSTGDFRIRSNTWVDGTVTSRGFTGDLAGNVTGNVTGTLTGNVTGNCSGTAGSVAYTNITGNPLSSEQVTLEES